MESITFKTEGFLFNLYTLTYSANNLPDDTCTYRGRLIFSVVIAIILSPLTIGRLMFRLLLKLHDKYNLDWGVEPVYSAWGYLVTFFITAISTAVGSVWFDKDAVINHGVSGNQYLDLLLFFIVGLGTLVTVIPAVYWVVDLIVEKAIPAIISWEAKYKSSKAKGFPEIEKPSQWRVLYHSMKEKYCKQIDWE